MKYNFDYLKSRKNTGSIKWNVEDGTLPMWIADMDFETAPCIIKAIKNKAKLGIYGYEDLSDEWYNAYINYWKKYHHLSIKKEDMCFSLGVIPILSSTIRKLSYPNENVVIMTPVYNIFTNSIVNSGRNLLASPLVYENGEYSIDFIDLENKLSNPQTTLLVLCNPHNPIGKIWDKETLIKIGELCKKHNVIVISDEIHCDIVSPGKEYIPFASASKTCRDISVTSIAPTKCFSIAGIQSAACVVFNEGIRNRVFKGLNTDEVAEGNTFSYVSAISAFKYGRPWLDEMNMYIQKNKEYVDSFVKNNMKDVYLIPSDATYLLWLDFGKIMDDTTEFCEYLCKEAKVKFNSGVTYGENGKQFIRINIATSKSNVMEGMSRLKKGLESYKGTKK